MNKSKLVLLAAAILIVGWMLLFQGTQPASSSPLLGITLTPTRLVPQVTVTSTVAPPTNTPVVHTPVVPTLPPPTHPQSTVVIIPVTGSIQSADMSGLANLGLVLLAFGLIVVGFSNRKK